MAPSVKLYYMPGSCSMAPQALLEDAGIEYESHKVDLFDYSKKSEYTKTVNPKGQLPAITIDGTLTTEIPAICTAISQLVPGKNYTGANPRDTVRFYEWMSYLGTTVHIKSFGPVFAPHKFSPDSTTFQGIAAKGKDSARDALRYIDIKLGESKTNFALGDYFSGVDAYINVMVSWAKHHQIWDEQTYPSLAAFSQRLGEMEAIKKVKQLNAA